MTKLKLADAERVILASAGAREDGLVLPTPKSLKKSAGVLDEFLRGLLTKDLIAERPTKGGEPIWATSESGERTTLAITATGLAAIGINGDRTEPIATAGGEKPHQAKGRPKTHARTATSSRGRPSVRAAETKSSTPAAAEKRETKLDLLVSTLRQRKGATIPEMMEVTGWQAHSVRGAISGGLKKRMGLQVASKAVDGRGRVYRIGAQTSK